MGPILRKAGEAMSIEQELFSWEGWDGDQECMIFYDVVLKVDIGNHKAGAAFDSATILSNNNPEDYAVLQLSNKGKREGNFAPNILRGQYKLHYRVGDEIPFDKA